MSAGLEYARFLRGLTRTEMQAFRTWQRDLRAGDKVIRRKARNQYSTWLDYMMVVGRISPTLRHKLEHYRMEDRHI